MYNLLIMLIVLLPLSIIQLFKFEALLKSTRSRTCKKPQNEIKERTYKRWKENEEKSVSKNAKWKTKSDGGGIRARTIEKFADDFYVYFCWRIFFCISSGAFSLSLLLHSSELEHAIVAGAQTSWNFRELYKFDVFLNCTKSCNFGRLRRRPRNDDWPIKYNKHVSHTHRYTQHLLFSLVFCFCPIFICIFSQLQKME